LLIADRYAYDHSGEPSDNSRLHDRAEAAKPLLFRVNSGSQSQGFVPNTYVDIRVCGKERSPRVRARQQDGQESGGNIMKSSRIGAAELEFSAPKRRASKP